MTGVGPFWLDPDEDAVEFPDVSLALTEPDGLLAVGGSLSSKRLLAAYRRGIFPWYSEGQPILWWSPDPRAVLFPDKIKISRSMGKLLRQNKFRCTMDHAFTRVIEECARSRGDGYGTWITSPMREAYVRLHEEGYAHSVEAWYEDKLVGGLYGICIGRIFFGESMFHRMSNASKYAFIKMTQQLQHWNIALIDCQVRTEHLDSLGAEPIPRERFIHYLQTFCDQDGCTENWKMAL